MVVNKPVESNEQLSWNFFTTKGFTREQTAGIMGNLKQEHNFKTDDVMPHGLGIAQWIGSRRQRLISKGNYLTLNTQLEFILEEFNTTEIRAGNALRASQTIEQATSAFERLYERCGDCRSSQRLQYAREIYHKYK